MTKGNIFRHRDTLAKEMECSNFPIISVLRAFLRAMVFLPAMDFNILSPLCAFLPADT